MAFFHVLSRYKIQALESGTGDLIAEDLAELIQFDDDVKIIDASERVVKEIFRLNPSLRYVYKISVERIIL